MCCWLIVAFAFAPRVALVLMWLFNNSITTAFGNIWMPLLGFFLLPWATLAFVLLAPGGLSTPELVIVVLAALGDLGAYGGGARARRS